MASAAPAAATAQAFLLCAASFPVIICHPPLAAGRHPADSGQKAQQGTSGFTASIQRER
jgi:hypothetical protein